MKVGIIGLPQTGKTSLYNALTRSQVDLNRFGAAEVNVGVIGVPDPRFEYAVEQCQPKKITPAVIEFTEGGARVERDEKQGSGTRDKFGTDFFASVRNMDALVMVVRAFDDSAIPAPPGGVNVRREAEAILEELLLADLGVVESRLEKLEKARLQKRQTSAEAVEHQVMLKIKNHLDSLQPVRTLELTEDERRSIRGYMFVSGKPLLLVANVGEDQVGEEMPASVAPLAEYARRAGLDADYAVREGGNGSGADGACRGTGVSGSDGHSRSRPRPPDPGRVCRARPAEFLHGGRGRGTGVDDHAWHERGGRGRENPQRPGAGLYSRRSDGLRRLQERRRLLGSGESRRQDASGRQRVSSSKTATSCTFASRFKQKHKIQVSCAFILYVVYFPRSDSRREAWGGASGWPGTSPCRMGPMFSHRPADEVGQLVAFGGTGSGRFLKHAHEVRGLPAVSEKRLPDQGVAYLLRVLQHFALHHVAKHQFPLFRRDVLCLAAYGVTCVCRKFASCTEMVSRVERTGRGSRSMICASLPRAQLCGSWNTLPPIARRHEQLNFEPSLPT